jgi:hypothetical protein
VGDTASVYYLKWVASPAPIPRLEGVAFFGNATIRDFTFGVVYVFTSTDVWRKSRDGFMTVAI